MEQLIIIVLEVIKLTQIVNASILFGLIKWKKTYDRDEYGRYTKLIGHDVKIFWIIKIVIKFIEDKNE